MSRLMGPGLITGLLVLEPTVLTLGVQHSELRDRLGGVRRGLVSHHSSWPGASTTQGVCRGRTGRVEVAPARRERSLGADPFPFASWKVPVRVQAISLKSQWGKDC